MEGGSLPASYSVCWRFLRAPLFWERVLPLARFIFWLREPERFLVKFPGAFLLRSMP